MKPSPPRIFAEDEIKIGALTLRPGIRYEFLDMDYTPAGGASQSADENLLMGGIGANYELERLPFAFRRHLPRRGQPQPAGIPAAERIARRAPATNSAAATAASSSTLELAGFFTDFDQLISTDAGFGTLNASRERRRGGSLGP